MEKALFGAGCFWGVEEYFRKIKGVINMQVGYSGGTTDNPTYQNVCYDNTDHAEVILIEYDESIISYQALLDNFWKCHDPTTLNKQGADIGTQYRSIIFYFSSDQKKISEISKENNQKKFQNKIVTEIVKAEKFFKAEEYHQNYIQKNTILNG